MCLTSRGLLAPPAVLQATARHPSLGHACRYTCLHTAVSLTFACCCAVLWVHPLQELKAINTVKLGGVTEDLLLESMRRHDAVWADDDPYVSHSKARSRNWAEEDTDTRFETESDMMELCDLAEIL